MIHLHEEEKYQMNEIVIGNKIAEARKAKGLSQAQFAQTLNVSPQAVSKWERGESLPDIIMLGKVTSVLGLSMNDFSPDRQETNIIPVETPEQKTEKKSGTPINMSFAGWKDVDLSGIDNLHERLSGANIVRCKFIGANLNGTIFKANNLKQNDFTNAQLRDCKFTMANLNNNNFEDADFSNTIFKGCRIDNNNLNNARFKGTEFNKSELRNLIFSGTIQDCTFVHNIFKKVEFVGATLNNTFFKGKLKGVTFIDCSADKITYEFLKSAGIDMTNINLV